jgi:hypothetical protein
MSREKELAAFFAVSCPVLEQKTPQDQKRLNPLGVRRFA